MNFDPMMYDTFMQAARVVLEQNYNRVGQQFAQGFMDEFTYNPNNGQSLNNAQRFYAHVSNEVMRLNNGSMVIRDRQQLFDIVQGFVVGVYNLVAQRQQQQSMNNGFGNRSTGFGNNGNGFNSGGSMFNQGNGFGQQMRPQAGSHLSDDVSPQASSTPPITPTPMPVQPMQATAPIVLKQTIQYADNPLDDIPETGIDWSSNETNPTWNGDKASDNRIVLGGRDEIKTRDSRFTIQAARGFHQEILDDPMQVARDFFTIVPDAVLGSAFFYKIDYNHLDIIDVPTADFIDIRDKCIDAVRNDPDGLLHKKLIATLKTMQYGAHQALTTYLVHHINRALYLSCRLSDKPDTTIQIEFFADLEELLSSNFRHSITTHSDGRFRLATIVSNAIWNALVKNTSVMFEDETKIPTHAIQSSPVFPYSIENVYPNKFSIPMSSDADAELFMNKMKQHELSRKTYLLSRRRVVVTNIFGKKVLPQVGNIPKWVNTPLAQFVNASKSVLPFGDANQFRDQRFTKVESFAVEDFPTDQLQNYLSDPKEMTAELVERHVGIRSVDLPVDQTIFALQYGVKPSLYMETLDVLGSVDDTRNQGALMIAHRDVPTLKSTT